MNRKVLFLLLPVLLIISASIVFYITSCTIGRYQSFLIGISFYWLFWCLLIPSIIKSKSIRFFLKSERPFLVRKNSWVILLFLSTIISPLFIYKTISNLAIKPIMLILLAIPLAVINGFCEEIFWRGLYVREFPNSIMWGIIIPSVFFSLWHFSPQIAMPQHNRFVFILSTLPLGMVNGIIAFNTKSAKWSAIGHSIGGILAFGGSSALSLYILLT